MGATQSAEKEPQPTTKEGILLNANKNALNQCTMALKADHDEVQKWLNEVLANSAQGCSLSEQTCDTIEYDQWEEYAEAIQESIMSGVGTGAEAQKAKDKIAETFKGMSHMVAASGNVAVIDLNKPGGEQVIAGWAFAFARDKDNVQFASVETGGVWKMQAGYQLQSKGWSDTQLQEKVRNYITYNAFTELLQQLGSS
mmetsp:Transcript_10427/g.20096  ORF Transcript_10427/g.20096 Transcript_10427/m.20096 type:complete len:198 (-) Transcript_10427:118-711(-)